MVAEKRLVEVWEEKMKANGHQFAEIKTTKAIYYRVAIIDNLNTILTVQFIRGSARKANAPNDSFKVVTENIAKREIVGDIKYYRE